MISESISISGLGSLISGISTAAIAICAWFGLRSWKSQERAKVRIRFLDDVLSSTYQYLNEIGPLIHAIKSTEIGIQSYCEVERVGGNEDRFAGLGKYVEAWGEKASGQILTELGKIRPIRTHIQTLSVKGQVLGFDGFEECFNACELIVSSCRQIEGYNSVIMSSGWNYDNPEVQSTIDHVFENVTSEKLQSNLSEGEKMLLSFVKRQYEKTLL